MSNENRPTFQVTEGAANNLDPYWNGLTKREYFAAMAMQGIVTSYMAKPLASDSSDPIADGKGDRESIAVASVKIADALLKALEADQ